MFSRHVGSGQWLPTRSGPLALDPHQERKLREVTVKVYFGAGRDFTSWLKKHQLKINCAPEADDLLVEWKNAPDGLSTCKAPTVNNFGNAIAFCEYVFPNWKGDLGWSHTVNNSWQKSLPIRHTVPCPRFLALVISLDMAMAGDTKAGYGFLLSQKKGWRPSEVCRLKAGDVSLPGEGWEKAVVALGVGRGTKSRPEEFALFDGTEELELELLRRLKAACPTDDTLLLGLTTAKYAAAIQRACLRLGIAHIGITAHSARAGFATDAVVRREKFSDIKQQGRWASDTSLKIYTDAIMSRAISSAASVARWRKLGDALETTILGRL